MLNLIPSEVWSLLQHRDFREATEKYKSLSLEDNIGTPGRLLVERPELASGLLLARLAYISLSHRGEECENILGEYKSWLSLKSWNKE